MRPAENLREAVNVLQPEPLERLETSLTFSRPGLVEEFVEASGGSVRDLLRLIESARLNAVVEGHSAIEPSDVRVAMKEFGIGLQKILIPSSIYFPILAEIAETKQWKGAESKGLTPDDADARRTFFHQLILEGAVFAYNGEGLWYDVHPTLHEVAGFEEACAAYRKADKPVKKRVAKPAKSHAKGARKK